MDVEERLRIDYDQTTELLRTLIDVRFKLLAFVPTISGAAVALFGRPRPPAELLAVGLLGLLATLGIFVYELYNSRIYGATVQRAGELERLLGFPSARAPGATGGLYADRPTKDVRLYGLMSVWQDRGLGFVYGAAFAGWTYLVVWGALRALDAPGARKIGALLGAAAAAAVIAEVDRFDRSG
jgi:hypothetical protein